MTKNNSVHEMVSVLKQFGQMTENEINKAAFGYDRNTSFGSNKKYADMLRRGMRKGLIDRQEIGPNFAKSLGYDGRSKFLYYATKEIKVPCSAELDIEWANESI
jgi:hypothetical protein